MARDALVAPSVALSVAAGGFAGAGLRYGLAVLWPGLVGTLAANAAGSFALGLVVYEARYTGLVSGRARTVVATGVLSSFTTYSTFVLQTARAPPLLLAANVVVTYALGIAGVLAGRELAAAVQRRVETPAAGGGD